MQFTGNYIMQAVCRTLIHSLWQGLIIAVLAGAVVLFTKRLRPTGRYAIFACLLLAFLVTAAVTFSIELNVFAKKAVVVQLVQPAGATTVNVANYTQPVTVNIPAAPVSFTTKLFAYFNAHANIIVLGWLLIIGFRCIQMLVGLRGVYILRHKGIEDAGEYWNRRLKQLAAALKVNTNIALFQSAIAKVPMVIGHFKPVILLPAGIITALPTDEIEAILLHELAHIRRKDYLVNMLQNFCEIIFFFNPAVLWVSSLIKDERENCCDDIALKEVKNKKQFIHALISFQEYNIAASKYAPGFPGRKDHLLNRVKRIITNNNKSLTNMEKALLATGIVLVGFVTITFAQTTKNTPAQTNKQKTAQAAKQQVTKQSEADAQAPLIAAADLAVTPPPAGNPDEMANTDTVPGKHGHTNFSYNTDYEGKRYEIIYEDDKVIELYVDGQRIPNDKIADYKEATDQMLANWKEQQKKFALQQKVFAAQQEQFREQQKNFQQQQHDMRLQQDSLRGEQYKQQQVLFKKQQEIYREQQRLYREQWEKMQHLRDSMHITSFGGDMAPYPPAEALMPAEPPMPAEPLIAPAPNVYPDAAPMALNGRVGALAPMQPARSPADVIGQVTALAGPAYNPHPPLILKPVVAPENKTVRDIIDYLRDNNVIVDEGNVTITLNNKSFTVNGAKQPEAMFNELKRRYIKISTDHVIYTSTNKPNSSSTHSDISINSN